MAARKPLAETIRAVAIVATTLFVLAIAFDMPGGWVMIGLLGAIVAWPTFAIVRAIENRPADSSDG